MNPLLWGAHAALQGHTMYLNCIIQRLNETFDVFWHHQHANLATSTLGVGSCFHAPPTRHAKCGTHLAGH